jgi:hypothetical protein
MPKITARGGVSALLGFVVRWFERYRCSAPYSLRKTASADALPLPPLFETGVVRRLGYLACGKDPGQSLCCAQVDFRGREFERGG